MTSMEELKPQTQMEARPVAEIALIRGPGISLGIWSMAHSVTSVPQGSVQPPKRLRIHSYRM